MLEAGGGIFWQKLLALRCYPFLHILTCPLCLLRLEPTIELAHVQEHPSVAEGLIRGNIFHSPTLPVSLPTIACNAAFFGLAACYRTDKDRIEL